MRDFVSKGRHVVQANNPNFAIDNLGLVCVILLDVSLQQMTKKSNESCYVSNDVLELLSDDFDGSDFSQYHSRLVCVLNLLNVFIINYLFFHFLLSPSNSLT